MFNVSPRIIFILPNIYECINGVSVKYKQFIQYLVNAQYEVILIIPFINQEIFNNLEKYPNLTIVRANGFNVPFYKEIKIPIISKKFIEEYIENENEIIVFNGEFIWLYTLLKKLKKKYKKIKLYPNMHTDYIHYAKNYYSSNVSNVSFNISSNVSSIFKNWDITSVFQYTDFYLQEKIFSGIIVTGEKMLEKYKNVTESIFNANEIDLSIFHSSKIDLYSNNSSNTLNTYKIDYNIIFCGRMCQEKNIIEILDCCLLLYEDISLSIELPYKNINFQLHMIGDGPYLENIKSLIETKYYKIQNNIIFYGSLSHEEIYKLYHSLNNRIFLFTSLSETFGKTPMEACVTGIPVFIKRCELSEYLYIDKKNGFLFNTSIDFIESFKYFLNLNITDKNMLISNGIINVKQYDQKKIFENWIYFLINGHLNKKSIINMFDIFTFHGITKMINCSGMILAD